MPIKQECRKRKKSLKIIEYAISHGINSLDTASGYGNSEMLIGEYIECQRLKILEKYLLLLLKCLLYGLIIF
ncbi:hypothetical protein F6Y05_32730 [Bacillus megaterium]|nr:hypothetical protein [Priestia megaterium]